MQPQFQKKLGHCVKYEQKQNAMIPRARKSIFYSQLTSERIANVEDETVYHFRKNITYYCVAPTANVCELEETNDWTFGRGLSHSCQI